ncbi:MAG: Ig-like domain-containing protein [Ilumatobacteraceae bacterium]
MHNRARRSRQIVVMVAIVGLVASIVVAAVRATGQADVRTQTNDGGAWLIRRDRGLTGHMNRAVGEVSGTVRVATPLAVFDVEESAAVLAALDTSTNTVSVIDQRTFQVANTLAVPADVRMIATDAGVVLWTPAPLRVWRLAGDKLADLTSLDGVKPLAAPDGDGSGLVTANADGATWVLDTATGTAGYYALGESAPRTVQLAEAGRAATAVSMVGDAVVAVEGGTGNGLVVTPDGDQHALSAVPTGAVLAQPAPQGTPVVAVGAAGTIVQAAAGGGTMAAVASAGGAQPVAPIVHDGCTYALVTTPPTLTRTCGGVTDQTVPLNGVGGASLRLRLVNGWIWVNDLDTGAAWMTTNHQEVQRVDEWGNNVSKDDGEGDQQQDADGAGQDQENPDAADAVFKRADQIDEDGINQPPVARDDTAATRTDQPVIVRVLANDEDPDGDVLLVSALDGVPADAQVTPTSDRAAVQVTPAPGFTGNLSFGYTITDGRGGDASAEVDVTVQPNDGSSNRPPLTETDVAEARAGAPTTVDVLANDSDPDGDTLTLESATADSGTVVFDPSGKITFTPDPGQAAGTVEVRYVAADAFGAQTEGTLKVQIRLDGSNNEPDARNDSAVTVVGKPITLDALANDTDPDGDPLTVAAAPTLLSPEGVDPGTYTATLSADGQFFFVAANPGQYLFRYGIIDGSESDSAVIRVDVDAVTDNRPPIAVRDDITIGRGGTRIAYVMQNDSDPDGDVIAMTGFTGAPGVSVDAINGVGLRITVAADAPSRVELHYQISDGRSDPVDGVVVVSVADAGSIDQAPVAKPDIVEVRAGRTVMVPVLLNDYDPEGEAIHVASIATSPSATARIGPGGQDVYVSVDRNATTGFSFGYDVADSAGNRTGSFVQVRLVPADQANRPPVARADVARTREGSTITIGVLANDTDPDGDPVRVDSIAAQPAFGTATVDGDGSITYASAGGFTGTDTFRYVVVDARGDRAIGDVLVGVLPSSTGNTPPTATDDAYTVLAGGDTVALDVLTNDSDADGDTLHISRAEGNAPAPLDADSTHVMFTPPASMSGDSQRFTIAYAIDDGHGGTDDATITVDVVASRTPVAPVAVDDVAGPVLPGTAVTVDVLANDLDPDGARSELTPSSTDPSLTFDAAGTATVVAGAASAEYAYTITDPDGLTSTAVLAVIVNDNLAPVVAPITATSTAGEPVTIDIGSQVTDPDGDVVFFACCDNPRGGSTSTDVSAGGQLTVTFTPDSAFAGAGGFSFRADDQHGHVVSAPVTVDVLAPANRPPTATDGTGSVEAGTTGTVSLRPFVTDPDEATGDVLTFALGTVPPGVSLAGSTVSVATPVDAGDTTIAVPFTVTDSAGAQASATVTVAVTPNRTPPPIAVADQVRITQSTSTTVAVLANDVDTLGQGLRVVSAGAVDANAAVTVNGDGGVTVTPDPTFFGSLHVNYTISDTRNSEAGQATGQLTVDVVGMPGAPPTPQATATNATATVTWGQAAANGSPIDDVQVAINGDVNNPVPVGLASSHVFTGLSNGVAVSFQVRAHNEAGWGPWSGASSPVTPDTQPDRPAAPTVTFGDGSLTVNWSAPTNQGSAITKYELEIGGGTSGVQQTGTTSYVWQNLRNGVSYQFRVTAINAAGRSESSAWSAAEHPLREPGAPGAPRVVQGDKYLDLSWTAPNDNGDPIVQYQVQMVGAPGAPATATGTSLRWSNLPNGTEQQFQVRARNRDADWGAWSPASAPVKPCGVPDAPAAPAATRGDQRADVSWGAPGDQGCAITGYEVRTSTGSQSATGTTHTFTGLANGTAYTFSVRAKNSVGWGAWSAASAAVTPAGVPQGPASITAKVSGVGEVALTWPAAAANGAAIARYEISINSGAARNVGNVTSSTVTGLGESTAYSFKVHACNDVGCGAWSSSDSATTWGKPDQVGTPSVSAGNATVDASWSAPAANGSAIDHYEAEVDPGGSKSVDGRSTSWSGLSNGTTYRVRVRACNAVGCGAWSGWASATPQSPKDVNISKGADAVGETAGGGSCTHSSCRWIDISASGFSPNTSYTYTCNASNIGVFSTGTMTTNGSGNGSRTSPISCYYGFPGQQVWVVLGGVRSNTINW